MYLSLAMMLIGSWLALGSASALLGVIAFIFLAERWYIVPEEKRLVATFRKQYEAYRMRTRRWL
jgi:protein-S-isoprenylcysteine O-methyltransferase Ste14